MIKCKLSWDGLGIPSSVMCLVPRLMLPLGTAALPAAQWLQTSIFHTARALVLLPVALLAVVPGLRPHGRASVAAVIAVGLSPLSTAALAGERLLSREWKTGLTRAGGANQMAVRAVHLALCRAYPAVVTHDHVGEHA